MAVGAGRLDTRCAFQKPVESGDGGGGVSVTWTTQFTVWGGFTYPRLSTRMEAVAQGAVQSAVGGELIVRDSSQVRSWMNSADPVAEEWRVLVTTDPTVSPAATQVWNIRGVQPRQHDGFVRLSVEAGVAT